MDERTRELLEYDGLLDMLARRARSEPGAAFCRSLEPDLSPEQVRERWALIDEARSMLGLEGPPPLEELVDLTRVLDRLSVEGAMLAPIEVLQVLQVARTSRRVGTFLRKRREISPRLADLADLPVFRDLEEKGDRSIGPDGEVLDTASVQLARVRRELSGLRGAIQSRLGGMMKNAWTRALQDDIITQRAGRYVIPVKSGQTREVPGLVHDWSSSGQTAYVEPLELVEDNNRLNYLKREERREVERVLIRLTDLCAQAAPALGGAAERLARIDALFAMADMSRGQGACAPVLDLRQGVDLKQARHPLLLGRLAEAGEKVAPLDIRLPRDRRVLVISGVNAGGKTVALKTLGLLALMAQTGLHLPVSEDSRLPLFGRVMAVIGDDQDLRSDLSTFSGHVRRLAGILDRAGDGDLCLLDELGTGTDPAEGAALALAVLDELKERGSFVVTATHYHLLKNWARLGNGSDNAAVRTDERGRPSFGLEYGAPGFSGGLAMARELGLGDDVVDRADRYLDEGQKKTLDLMQRLEEERAGLASARREAEQARDDLDAEVARSKQAEKKRVERYNKKREELDSRVKKALNRAEKEFKQIKKGMKSQAVPSEGLTARFREAQKELRAALPEPPRPVEPVGNVRPGDRVHVAALDKDGVVLTVQAAKGLAEIDLDGMKVRTRLSDLGRPSRREKPKKTETVFVTPPQVSTPQSELNILGYTVEEALPEIEKTLDKALLGGLKHLAIIHGIGTGRLREAVREYLNDSHVVKDFRAGDPRAGGEGVTVVELGD